MWIAGIVCDVFLNQTIFDMTWANVPYPTDYAGYPPGQVPPAYDRGWPPQPER